MTPLLVLRPGPGAAQTIAAARAMGLEAIAAPLFTVEAVDWTPPPGDFDALMLTSANAVRFGGTGLAGVRSLPAYAVGDATAAAARAAGLNVVHVGSLGAASLVAAMRERGVRHALHLAGEVHREIGDPGFMIDRAIVYRSVPADRLPMLPDATIALVHSPDAGCLFARLVDPALRSQIRVICISDAAAARMGDDWKSLAVAPHPTDAALLAIAAELCEEEAKGSDG